MSNNNKNQQKNGPKKPALALQGSMAKLGNISDMLKRKDPAPSPAQSAENANPTSFPINKVHADPNQPRKDFSEDKLRELADSIRQHGLIQPIILQPHPALPGEWSIVAGERRWRASQLAGKTDIPAVITTLTPQEVVAVQLIENIQREDLSPLEVAQGYWKLQQEFNLTQEEVAQAVGKSKQTVSDYLKVLEMPQDFQLLLSAKSVRGAADLNALWRLSRQHPERAAALIAGASEESPITRVMIRTASSASTAPAQTGESPAGRTSDSSGTPAAQDGEGGGTPPLSDANGLGGQSKQPGEGGEGRAPATKNDNGAGTAGSTPPVKKDPEGTGTPGGSQRNALPSSELVYTISTAHKNGEWIATVRLANERLFASEPVATSAEAVAQAATWLRDNSSVPS